jgi:predicted nucleic acid-binding protein
MAVGSRTPALGDTSVFIALEQGRGFAGEAPSQLAVSFVTVAELTVGVLTAATAADRTRRLETLIKVRSLEALPVDGRVASVWAELRVALRDAGRKLPINDSWIAATAIAHGLPIVTQDGDYQDVPGLDVIRV